MTDLFLEMPKDKANSPNLFGPNELVEGTVLSASQPLALPLAHEKPQFYLNSHLPSPDLGFRGV